MHVYNEEGGESFKLYLHFKFITNSHTKNINNNKQLYVLIIIIINKLGTKIENILLLFFYDIATSEIHFIYMYIKWVYFICIFFNVLKIIIYYIKPTRKEEKILK